MARAKAALVGFGACPRCGKECTYRRSAGGLLKGSCDRCAWTWHSDENGPAYKADMATIPDLAPPAATPAAPAAPAAPVPPPKPPGFSLGNL